MKVVVQIMQITIALHLTPFCTASSINIVKQYETDVSEIHEYIATDDVDISVYNKVDMNYNNLSIAHITVL